MRVLGVLVGAMMLVAAGAAWGEFEQIVIENAGLTRVVSGTSNILKTTRISMGDTRLVDEPSVEFMIEIEANGERLTLVPGDFDIKAIDTAFKGKEKQTSIEMRSHYWGYPLVVYVDYWNDARNTYQQKSVAIAPCKTPAGATIRRITLESLRFVDALQPIAPTSCGFANEARSSFAAVDAKSGKGLCWDFPAGTAEFARRHSLTAYEEMNAPLAKGYQTGRLTLGAVSGKPAAVFAGYRQALLETRYPSLAKNSKYAALRKRFAQCFAACAYLPPCSDDGLVDAEARIAGNKGFVMIFNCSGEARKAALLLSDASLALTGDLKLSDWSALDRPSDLETIKAGGKIEVEIPARGCRIIGVNIDG